MIPFCVFRAIFLNLLLLLLYADLVVAFAAAPAASGESRRLVYRLELRISSTVAGRNNRLSVEGYYTSYEGQQNSQQKQMIEVTPYSFARLPAHLL